MKNLNYITLIAFLILSLKTNGQKLTIVSTDSLIKISEIYGLDSALILTRGLPIYCLDKEASMTLAKHSLKNKPSNIIDNFLIDYAMNVKDKNIPMILLRYFTKRKDDIKNYEPDDIGFFQSVSGNDLSAFIKNASPEIDTLLIEYYNEWLKKTSQYESNYLNSQKTSDPIEKLKRTAPFESSNLNCYKILLALDSIKSKFYDVKKLEYHKNYFQTQYGVNIYETYSFEHKNFKNPSYYKTLKLLKQYSHIGEIDFKNEPTINQILGNYYGTNCWKFLIYDNKTGYLDLGCVSDPEVGQGIKLKLQLNKNELILYVIESWIS